MEGEGGGGANYLLSPKKNCSFKSPFFCFYKIGDSNFKVNLIGAVERCEATGSLVFPDKDKIAAERAFKVQDSS